MHLAPCEERVAAGAVADYAKHLRRCLDLTASPDELQLDVHPVKAFGEGWAAPHTCLPQDEWAAM